MPVIPDSKMHNSRSGRRETRRDLEPEARHVESAVNKLTIGLINNMPDSALLATERQFFSLLNSASNGISVHLSLYSLPGVPRSEVSARRIARLYSSTEVLKDVHLDGLIVTGRECLAADLADEPYWGSFTQVVEWARRHTYSTIWSCLAAHAAVQYLDGIRRVRNRRKHSGLFECRKISDHPITTGTPSRFRVPHSRWNSVREEDLARYGYDVLTRTANANVDAFLKQEQSLFIFFQGHPEYESTTLLLEYRRDVGRYLRKESDVYPSIPQDYFGRDTTAALADLEKRAKIHRNVALVRALDGILGKACFEPSWQPTAVKIYRNWLDYICTQKEQRKRLISGAAHPVEEMVSSSAGSECRVPASFL